jgi:hypothetical protein
MAEEKISFWFATIDVCGMQIPTENSCKAMASEIKDLDNWLVFTGFNNWWASTREKSFNPHHYLSTCDSSEIKELNLRSRLIKIDEIQTELSRCFDFSTLRKARAIVDWHLISRGNFTGSDNQQLIKASRTILSKVKKGEAELSDVKFPTVKRYHHLLECGKSISDSRQELNNEYSATSNYVTQFCKHIDYLSDTNECIKSLIYEQLDIHKQLLIIAKNAEPHIYHFSCPFCGKCQVVPKRKKPKSCGSDECDLKYKTQWEEKNRPRTTSDPDGWIVAFDGKPRLCMGIKCDDGLDQGGRLRQVNVECLCRECYPESIDR